MRVDTRLLGKRGGFRVASRQLLLQHLHRGPQLRRIFTPADRFAELPCIGQKCPSVKTIATVPVVLMIHTCPAAYLCTFWQWQSC